MSDDKLLNEEFDFDKAVSNPYAKQMKKQITIKLDYVVIEYFKNESVEVGVSYKTLINLYLVDCVKEQRKLKFNCV